MNYNSWLKLVPVQITDDPLWKIEAYRLSLFLADLSWHDTTKLLRNKRTISLFDQLYRATGSVGANISEGYSRSSGKDRVRFYEYSLGSARETRGWYFNSRHNLGEKVAEHRMNLVTQIIKLLLKMIPDQRDFQLKEESIPYHTEQESSFMSLAGLLNNVPMPGLTHHESLITEPEDTP